MNPGALASLCLVVGGGLLVSSAAVAAAANRRVIAGRVSRLHVPAAASVLKPAELDRSAGRDRLRQAFTYGMKQNWGVRRSGATLLVVAMLAALAAAAAGMALSLPIWLAAPLGLVAGCGLSRLLANSEQRRAEVQFTEHFPGALDTVVRVLRAGLPISAAIRAVTEEAPESVAQIFGEMADQLDIGVSMSDALAYATQRVHIGDFRFFTVSVALQHATGGNLASTLETLTDIIRRRRGVRLKVKALTAEVRMSSYILGAVPLLVLAGLSVVAPTYLSPLFHDPRGKLILIGAATNLAAGFFTMRALMRRAALD